MITAENLPQFVEELSSRDSRLREINSRFGTPPLWKRDEGFQTFIHLILEQQVSLASALAAFNKLNAATGTLTPDSFLKLNDDELKTIGFSRQKTEYGRHVARAIIDGTLDVDALREFDDEQVRTNITRVKGLGPWTSDIYLLMVLGRPDVWPSGDLALAVAVKELFELDSRPSRDELENISEAWKPYRAVAARLLWHYYLSTR